MDPTFSWTVSPAAVRLPGERELRYRLRIATGAEIERFTLTLEAPRYEVRAGASTLAVREGTTIAAMPYADPILVGPGRIEPTLTTTATLGCASGVRLAPHGYEPRTESFVLEIPANSVTTLRARYRTGAIALWPGADLRLTARIEAASEPLGPPTLALERNVRSPNVAISGWTGTRIDLWTTPPSSPSGLLARQPALRRGGSFRISGRATPPPPGRRVTLKLRHSGTDERPRVLARVRTLRDGTFSLRTRVPTRGGRYQLWAHTPAAAGIAADYSCPIGFAARD